jgi:ABC-2 type transport system permease protein
MKKLLYIEFIKYSRSRMFYGFMGLYFALIVLMDLSNGGGDKSVYNLPVIWHNLVYFVSYINFFVGLIALISITSEFQYRTIRQHIVDGLNRENYFLAKYLYAIMLAAFTCLFVFCSVAIIGMTHTWTEPLVRMGKDMTTIQALSTNTYHSIFEGTGILLDYFIQLLGYLSLAVFIGILFRSTAIASIFYIIYVLMLEPLVSWGIFHTDSTRHFQAFFPKTLFSSVVEPLSLVKALGTNNGPPFIGIVKNAPDHQTVQILVCVYILVFAGASYWLIKRRDV